MSIRLKITLFIVFIFIVGLGNIFVIFQLEKYGDEKLTWVTHTNEVLMQAEKLLNALQGAETGQRGFLLTKDSTYLKPYTSGIINTKTHFDNLQSLTTDNTTQQSRLHLIKELIELKLSELDTTVTLTNDNNDNSALEIVMQNTGRLHMDKIRDLLKKFTQMEMSLLENRTNDYMRNRNVINTFYYIEITLFTFFVFIAMIFLNRNLFTPLKLLLSYTNKMRRNEKVNITAVTSNDEIGYLFSSFYKMYETISERTKELEVYQEKLEIKIEEEVEKNKQHSAYLIQQSRLAQMGEMISMIAHQWRQPLAAISAISGTLTIDVMMDEYKKEFFHERLDAISELSQHLSSTINDFRDFYKPNKELTTIMLHETMIKAISIIDASLKSQSIIIKEIYQSKSEIKIHENELIQVFLSILKNAQDNFTEKHIEKPTIDISVYDKDNSVLVEIHDNGGGIPTDIINKIFDPYFSTKDKKDGTGLGLYMSKLIIEEHHKGQLRAINTEKGAKFVIELPIDNI